MYLVIYKKTSVWCGSVYESIVQKIMSMRELDDLLSFEPGIKIISTTKLWLW